MNALDNAWATTLPVAIAAWAGIVVTVFLAVRESRERRQEGRRGRTLRYVSRFAEPQTTEIILEMRKFIEAPQTETEREQAWRLFEQDKDSPDAVAATTAFDQYEEMGAMAQYGLLEQNILSDLIAPAAADDYRRARWLIERHRKKTGRPAWRHWEMLAQWASPADADTVSFQRSDQPSDRRSRWRRWLDVPAVRSPAPTSEAFRRELDREAAEADRRATAGITICGITAAAAGLSSLSNWARTTAFLVSIVGASAGAFGVSARLGERVLGQEGDAGSADRAGRALTVKYAGGSLALIAAVAGLTILALGRSF